VEASRAELSILGGVRIGWVNASWPLARLFASATRLKLSGLLGTYDFLSSDVVSLERYGSIPILYSGVRIVHVRSDYPAKIIFWNLGRSEKLISKIKEIGFSPTAPASRTARRSFPMRWTAILVFLVAWNGLFVLGGYFHTKNFIAPLALSLTFLVCLGTRMLPSLQRMVLRDGHSVNEIESVLLLIQTVSGLLLAIFALMLFAGSFAATH
jgi:hypothetical protein